jgi:hypothetical protein
MNATTVERLNGDLLVEVFGKSTYASAVVPKKSLARPTAVGSRAPIRVPADGVLGEHALLQVKDDKLFVATMDREHPVTFRGCAVPEWWVALPLPCNIQMGAVSVRMSESPPSLASATDPTLQSRPSSASEPEPPPPRSRLAREWTATSPRMRAVALILPAVIALLAAGGARSARVDRPPAVADHAPREHVPTR